MQRIVLLTAAASFLAVSCGGGGETAATPADAVDEMFQAIAEGNGERAVSYMSSSAMAEMEEQFQMIQQDPEASAQQLRAVGIEIDAEEIPDMTARDFGVRMISSPMMETVMQEAEITVGEVTMDGDVAHVEVTTTIMGETETNTIDVVKEEGQWKVTEFGMRM